MNLTAIISKLNKTGKRDLARELLSLAALKIGLAEITSKDLEEYATSSGKGATDREKEIGKLLRGKVEVGKFFDWKEEERIDSYINRFQQKNPSYKYVYNAYPDGDGWLVVFSKVKLSKAEII